MAGMNQTSTEAVTKRYEGLMMVRTKAIKGKGAWYWAHLEPILIHHPDSGLPKAVKLRCSLCDAVFSASNPSRTASEHLKRATCPSFNVLPSQNVSTLSLPPPPPPPLPESSSSSRQRNLKRSCNSSPSETPLTPSGNGGSFEVMPLTVVDPARFSTGESFSEDHSGGCFSFSRPKRLVLSGGKDDLGALAMLEDSVKKLKAPKTSPSPTLTKSQIELALDLLADWIYESCGSISISGLEHPKFKEFLWRVGLPMISTAEFTGRRLNSKYEKTEKEIESRISDAIFFQIATDGWKKSNLDKKVIGFTVNLPNGSSCYWKAEFVNGYLPPDLAEEILQETVTEICGDSSRRCIGIISDGLRSTALKNMENQHPWMINLSCQVQGFNQLIKDFHRKLPLFKTVARNCIKLGNFIKNSSRIRFIFGKYQKQLYGQATIWRQPLCRDYDSMDFGSVYDLVDDILDSARTIQSVMHDGEYKLISMEDPDAREIEEMVGDVGFWNELEAVQTLTKLIKGMARKTEMERSLIGQCLPLWDEMKTKAKDWCLKYRMEEEQVEKVIEQRFRKNYHPAWSAAFVLDPLYLIMDTGGKYLPPFKFLTPTQENDVETVITRLVAKEESHFALMEMMRWRSEGLDPMYARAVQMKEKDATTGKMRLANPHSSRLAWETYLSEFKCLKKAAVKLIFLHATSCGFKCKQSLLKTVNNHGIGRIAVDRAKKLTFLSANSRLERREFSSDEEMDADIVSADGED